MNTCSTCAGVKLVYHACQHARSVHTYWCVFQVRARYHARFAHINRRVWPRLSPRAPSRLTHSGAPMRASVVSLLRDSAWCTSLSSHSFPRTLRYTPNPQRIHRRGPRGPGPYASLRVAAPRTLSRTPGPQQVYILTTHTLLLITIYTQFYSTSRP